MHKNSTDRVRTCLYCGVTFVAPKPSSPRVFCSKVCSNRSRVPPVLNRFWESVDKSGDCWMWTGHLCTSGYGSFLVKKKQRLAHRFSWELVHGPIPPGLCVCHDCDKNYPIGDKTYRRCVNPAHLFLGTHLDNMRDASRKGRSAAGDRHGLRLHPERAARGDRNGSRTHPERRPRGEKQGLHQRGERNHAAKLTAADVLEIRSRAGTVSNAAQARVYGVSKNLIGQIIKRKAWRYV